MKSPKGPHKTASSTSVWAVPSGVKAIGKDWISWSPKTTDHVESTSGPSLSFIDRFASLSEATDEEVLHFAATYGVLGICGQHDLPATHVPHRIWNYVVEVTGDFDGDAGDNYNPCRPVGSFRQPKEKLSTWRRFAQEAQDLMTISAELSRPKPEIDPALWFRFPDLFHPGQSLPRIEDQHNFLSARIQWWLDLGDVRVRYQWRHRQTPILDFDSSTLFGALALQLAFAVGTTQGLAICKNCARAYVPEQRANAKYCSFGECKRASRRDATRQWRIREADKAKTNRRK